VTGQEINLYPEDMAGRARLKPIPAGDGALARFRFESPFANTGESVCRDRSALLLETIQLASLGEL